jgi:hypothetical protein
MRFKLVKIIYHKFRLNDEIDKKKIEIKRIKIKLKKKI